MNTMKILIIGATGMAGSEIVQAASNRGHKVIALARSEDRLKELRKMNPGIKLLVKDVFQLSKEELSSVDVIVNAFSVRPEKAYLHVDLAAKLISFFRETETPRLVFILGAGSLHTGTDHHLLVKDMEKDPKNKSFIAVPQNQLKEFNFLKEVDNVNWVGISPAASLHAGKAKSVLKGKEDLLFNENGKSETSSGTMVQAVLDEIEKPVHRQVRFTVADGIN
ncbi:NAD(P)-dependent oxidoreductase [Oenococcus oeni]|uniref:NAD(P)-dependent oxidoreductase n=1 Tax=Oenococcus oeni TaxID=1247 RepID=UPI0022864F86|nr:NAD(P)H-binding protein [Oenococcus oeni]